jgi:hypothetical protein
LAAADFIGFPSMASTVQARQMPVVVAPGREHSAQMRSSAIAILLARLPLREARINHQSLFVLRKLSNHLSEYVPQGLLVDRIDVSAAKLFSHTLADEGHSTIPQTLISAGL